MIGRMNSALLALAVRTDPVHVQAVVGHLVAQPGGNVLLPRLDGFIDKFVNPAACHAQDMVMVGALVEFEA